MCSSQPELVSKNKNKIKNIEEKTYNKTSESKPHNCWFTKTHTIAFLVKSTKMLIIKAEPASTQCGTWRPGQYTEDNTHRVRKKEIVKKKKINKIKLLY